MRRRRRRRGCGRSLRRWTVSCGVCGRSRSDRGLRRPVPRRRAYRVTGHPGSASAAGSLRGAGPPGGRRGGGAAAADDVGGGQPRRPAAGRLQRDTRPSGRRRRGPVRAGHDRGVAGAAAGPRSRGPRPGRGGPPRGRGRAGTRPARRRAPGGHAPPGAAAPAGVAGAERYLTELRRVFEEACAWVREQLRRSEARDAPPGAESGPPGPGAVPEPQRPRQRRSTARRRWRADRGAGRPCPGRCSPTSGGAACAGGGGDPSRGAGPPRGRHGGGVAAAGEARPGEPHAPAARRLRPVAGPAGRSGIASSPYDAYYRARAEEDHHAPAINREHARQVAEHGNGNPKRDPCGHVKRDPPRIRREESGPAVPREFPLRDRLPSVRESGPSLESNNNNYDLWALVGRPFCGLSKSRWARVSASTATSASTGRPPLSLRRSSARRGGSRRALNAPPPRRTPASGSASRPGVGSCCPTLSEPSRGARSGR